MEKENQKIELDPTSGFYGSEPGVKLQPHQVNPKTKLEMVKEFHAVFGHPTEPTHPRLRSLTVDQADRRIDFITSELQEFREAMKQLLLMDALVHGFDALIDAEYFLYGTAVEMGSVQTMLDEIFIEVHRANMTKACKSIAEAISSCLAYRNGTHPQQSNEVYDVHYRKQGEYWVVYDIPTGKILKSINTEKPNIKPIIEKYMFRSI